MKRQKPQSGAANTANKVPREPGTTSPPSKSQTLTNRLKRGQAPDEATAELVVAGLGANAVTAVKFSAMTYGEVDLTSCLNALVDSAERVNRGDLGEAEALLTAQAVTLNAMFTNLVSRARDSQYVESFDRYMRFGLKAQAQCRATLETLAAIKNPPTIIARQANIASGPQQVNNTTQLPEDSRVGAISGTTPTELLEAHVERVDAGTEKATSRGDSAMEAVGIVNRPPNRRG